MKNASDFIQSLKSILDTTNMSSHLKVHNIRTLVEEGIVEVEGYIIEEDIEDTGLLLIERLKETTECLHEICCAKPGEPWGWDWEKVICENHQLLEDLEKK